MTNSAPFEAAGAPLRTQVSMQFSLKPEAKKGAEAGSTAVVVVPIATVVVVVVVAAAVVIAISGAPRRTLSQFSAGPQQHTRRPDCTASAALKFPRIESKMHLVGDSKSGTEKERARRRVSRFTHHWELRKQAEEQAAEKARLARAADKRGRHVASAADKGDRQLCYKRGRHARLSHGANEDNKRGRRARPANVVESRTAIKDNKHRKLTRG